MTWLEAFKECFGHRAQKLAVRRYVQGLLSDSSRKSMEAMLARVTDPGSYQAFQYFITESVWEAEHVWRRLRALIPEREGLLILDGTSFPKQGKHSVGVARQYCGALGKIANCQVAVTAALWTGVRAYLLGAALYLPEEWVTDTARDHARVPSTITFQEKWRQALTLLRQVRASGFSLTGVLADAEFGDNSLFLAMLHRLRLPFAVGVSSQLTVFQGTPRLLRRPPHLTAVRANIRTWPPASRRSASPTWRPGSGGGTRSAGATAARDIGGRSSVWPCASPRRTTGAIAGSPPKSGCCANGKSARRLGRNFIW